MKVLIAFLMLKPVNLFISVYYRYRINFFQILLRRSNFSFLFGTVRLDGKRQHMNNFGKIKY